MLGLGLVAVLAVIKNAKAVVVADGAIAVAVRLVVLVAVAGRAVIPTPNRVKTAVRIAVRNVVKGVIENAVKVAVKPVVKTAMKVAVKTVMKNAPNRAKKPATRVVKIAVMKGVILIATRDAIGATADKAKAKLRVWANISQVF